MKEKFDLKQVEIHDKLQKFHSMIPKILLFSSHLKLKKLEILLMSN